MPQTFDDIDALCTATYNQLIAIGTLKASIVTALAAALAAGIPDFTVVNGSGDGGGDESYTQVSATAKITALSQSEALLTTTYEEQCKLRNGLFPYVERGCHRSGGIWI